MDVFIPHHSGVFPIRVETGVMMNVESDGKKVCPAVTLRFSEMRVMASPATLKLGILGGQEGREKSERKV